MTKAAVQCACGSALRERKKKFLQVERILFWRQNESEPGVYHSIYSDMRMFQNCQDILKHVKTVEGEENEILLYVEQDKNNDTPYVRT